MTLAELNKLPRYRAEEEFLKCCGSTGWVRAMARRRPFANFERLLQAATEIWRRLDASDWMEAFGAHPRIGDRRPAAAWSAEEQSGMNRAATAVATAIEEANQEYFKKFGFIFIICASGKSAEEMLASLRSRMSNPPEEEIRVAAEEQNKITHLRLRKLFIP
ncbi:MAG: 2-oxo-4-hydroxy-4-carboxy-5-ureidoimidazoline decarboxylase [Acidobacteriia bacterium]|nr:2-oxo-4-hydroxy-4-carboxy-5-ureidoimidazoline decarboxylase [Terriglobia bacterium]